MHVDPSALIEFLAGRDTIADKVRESGVGQPWAAPHAIDLECASTLRGLVRRSKLSADEAARALTLLRRMRLRRFEHDLLLPRVWELRHTMWPYDAAYVALAELLDAELLTVDTKFERVPGLRCVVRCLR
ncbi:type II toxin-antitoxin system VapC family toxin [Saccharomonospora saliphila]|uniref:type II toxin-antitoxin system VapC family toxin n=1 Tax=Saccharomonospora saliphila TaxID=369829 RepID=UPI00035EC5F4|nr:type II toxin-antitoxin system VapC family toxin [Saccharomonospora saliphila]